MPHHDKGMVRLDALARLAKQLTWTCHWPYELYWGLDEIFNDCIVVMNIPTDTRPEAIARSVSTEKEHGGH